MAYFHQMFKQFILNLSRKSKGKDKMPSLLGGIEASQKLKPKINVTMTTGEHDIASSYKLQKTKDRKGLK